MPRSELSLLQSLASLTPAQRERALRDAQRASRLPRSDLERLLLADWRVVGRPKQQPPDGDWFIWFVRAGRGFGKTLSAAQWAKRQALRHAGCRFALVAPTFGDARDTQVEGETGILSILPESALKGGSRATAWNRSLGELALANGSRFKCFSSDQPDRLRGPQHHFVWGEEVSSWKDARLGDQKDTTFSNAKLGCRLGERPQMALTSTPKPNKLTKELLALPESQVRVVIGSSYENRDNLAEAWWQQVVAPLEGTRTGRQEIHAEVLEDVEGALWTRAMIDAGRIREGEEPVMSLVLVGVDPNASSSEAANSAGIVVVGRGHSDRHGYVLDDRTVDRGGPAVWAQAAVDAYHDWEADAIVGETNNGGEMVAMVIKAVDPSVVFWDVKASRGKRTRAEPVAALYEENDEVDPPRLCRVHHAGVFPELEEEQTTWTPDADSPDRMDALVWGVSKLGIWAPLTASRSSVPRGRIPGVDARLDPLRR